MKLMQLHEKDINKKLIIKTFYLNFIWKSMIDNVDGICSRPPRFVPGHLYLSVTGPDGPPTFKT